MSGEIPAGSLSVSGLSVLVDESVNVAQGAHKFWRLLFVGDDSLDAWHIDDVELKDSNNALLTDYGNFDIYTLGAEYEEQYLSGYNSFNAWPGSSTFQFLYLERRDRNRWIKVELANAGDVQAYTFSVFGDEANTGSDVAKAPTGWLLQWSDDDEHWYTRHVASADWSAGQPRTKSFDLGATATGEFELPLFTVTGEGIPNDYQEGTIFGVLPSLSATGQADNSVINLPALTMEGEISPGSVLSTFLPIELPAFVGTGELGPGQFLTFDAELPALSMLAEGYQYGDLVGWVLPELVMTGESVRGTTGPIDIDLPAFELSAVGFDDSVTPSTLPEFTLIAEGIGGQVAVMFETLPWFELTGAAFNGTDQATSLPELEMAGTGVAGQPGDAYLYLSALTMDAEGYSGDAPTEQGTAVIETDLPMIELEAQGIAGNVYEGGGALQSLVLAAEGVTGQLGSIDITLPALELDANGSVEQFAVVNIDLPMIRLTGTATNPVTADTTAIAVDGITGITMNVLNRALSTRAGLSFNSMTEFNGVTLAASSEGLFVMTGDTDHGQIIEASVRLGKHDFDVPQLKTIADCYVGYSASGALELTACADDGQEYCYPLQPRKHDRHTSRSKLGRGLKGRYIQLGIDNVLGSNFMIDNMEPKPRVMKRQVK